MTRPPICADFPQSLTAKNNEDFLNVGLIIVVQMVCQKIAINTIFLRISHCYQMKLIVWFNFYLYVFKFLLYPTDPRPCQTPGQTQL